MSDDPNPRINRELLLNTVGWEFEQAVSDLIAATPQNWLPDAEFSAFIREVIRDALHHHRQEQSASAIPPPLAPPTPDDMIRTVREPRK